MLRFDNRIALKNVFAQTGSSESLRHVQPCAGEEGRSVLVMEEEGGVAYTDALECMTDIILLTFWCHEQHH